MKVFEVIENDIDLFKQAFEAFLKGKAKNQWLYGGNDIQVYVRKGYHAVGDKMFTTLDIANISIEEKGKGTGMQLIWWLHQQNPFQVTFIESLLNRRLYERLKKDGWLDVPNSYPPSVYLIK